MNSKQSCGFRRVVIFYYEGLVYHEYAPTGQAANKDSNAEEIVWCS